MVRPCRAPCPLGAVALGRVPRAWDNLGHTAWAHAPASCRGLTPPHGADADVSGPNGARFGQESARGAGAAASGAMAEEGEVEPGRYSAKNVVWTEDRPVRLYADGIFDMFHFGHARALEQAKKLFPDTYLIVGVCSDATTHRFKGKTVMTEDERYESLRHCAWVDEVVEDAPWVLDDAFLERHKIDFVCHDALPYVDNSGQSSSGDVYEHLKKQGKFLETQRTEGISTTDIICRIVRDYDSYVRRNIQRGISADDMNLPFIKRQELAITGVTQGVKKNVEALWHRNEELLDGFIDLFGRDGRIRTMFREFRKGSKKRIEEFSKSTLM